MMRIAGKIESARLTLAEYTSNPTSKYAEGKCNVMFWGRIYNKTSLGYAVSENEAKIVSDLFKVKGFDALKAIDSTSIIIIVEADGISVMRDHHGTFAQVYYTENGFATCLSDIKGNNSYSPEALSIFLSTGYIPTPHSAFKGINKLEAGSAVVFKKDSTATRKIYTIPVGIDNNSTLDDFASRYGELHEDAIKRRIDGCNDVGMLLSGGYDSGSNLAALRRIYSGTVRTFSIGFRGDTWTELPLARCMSKAFDTEHSEYEITGGEITFLPDIVKFLGDPFVEGGLMVNYCAMKMIGENKPQIILGGDGSDQYFGTSGREVALSYLASKYGIKPILKLLFSLLSCDRFEKNNKLYRVRFHLDKILNILAGDRFGLPQFLLKDLLNDSTQLPVLTDEKEIMSSWEDLYAQHAIVSDLNKIINQVILFKASRMAEMFGNNISFPFMDNELFNFLQTVPVKYKCNGVDAKSIAKGNSTAKYLLKYHYKPMLPTEITSKKKQGGFAPMPLFFNDNTQRRRIADFIMSSSVVGDYLKKEAVERFIKKYDAECKEHGSWFWYRQNKAIQYFNILTLSIWWEQNIKNNNNISL